MTFSEQLKAHRQRLGLTQSEAAELLEVSASWVDKAEREQREPLKITQEGALARLSKAKTRRKGTNEQAVPAAAGGSESTQEPSPPLGTSA